LSWNAPVSENEIAWQRALERGTEIDGRRVEFHHWKGTHERLHRVAYPHGVLCGSSLGEQGVAMGRWIVETFECFAIHSCHIQEMPRYAFPGACPRRIQRSRGLLP
jgi:hypothetical protein